jgi:hypothetical protein
VVNVAATGRFSDKNVGTAKTVNLTSNYSGADVGNYSITDQTSTTANITPAALVISGMAANNKTYDGTTVATVNLAGVRESGLVSGDVVNVAATGRFSDKNVGTAKTVNLTSSYSGADVGNYSITDQTTTTANITPAALLVVANNATKNADGQGYTGGNGVSFSGLVNNETASVLGGSVAYGGSSQGAINAGTYTITPSGLSSNNYTIAYQDGSLVISPSTAASDSNSAGALQGFISNSMAATSVAKVASLVNESIANNNGNGQGNLDNGLPTQRAGSYDWPALKAVKLEQALEAGLLPVTVLRPEDGATVSSAIAFEQNSKEISIRSAAQPLTSPSSDKVVFSSKMTEFLVQDASGKMVGFTGGMINKRLVIVAPTPESKQLAQAQMNMVIAGAIMALGNSSPIMLAKIEGFIIDLR